MNGINEQAIDFCYAFHITLADNQLSILMFSFNIFAIPVRVEPFFWVTMALIGGGLSARDSLSLLLILMFMLAGFISILVHELGHALTIRKFGFSTEITLHSFGGYASYSPEKLSRKQSFLISIAGPGLQIVLALLVLIIRYFIPVPHGSLLNVLMSDLIGVSIIWALLNCIPIYPMDGGQMMAAMLGPSRKNLVYLISVALAIFIGLASALFLNSLLLPVFMGLFAWQNWQAYENSLR